MKSKSFIFLTVLIFMIVFSLSAVSADDSQIDSDTVSGDVDVVTVNPFSGSSSDQNHSGELTYGIPSDANIKKADVYVNVYSGSATNTYGAIANVSLNTTDGENQIASEELWIEEGSADGTVYPVNNHTNKCYSDYQMHYDITDSLKGLNGSSILLKVDTFPMDGKQFDGRIKLIALVLAYDDGDDDTITYFVDSTQRWTNSNTTTTFNTKDLKGICDAELINIALSNTDGSYSLNNVFLGDADTHTSGNYYQYNGWNVTDKITEGSDTQFLSRAGQGAYGPSIKNVLSVLKVASIKAEVSLATEYTSVYSCYAGTNNTLTIKVNSNKAGKYVVELLADGNVVNSTETDINGETTLLLTDPTVRAVDETTVNGADNKMVVYAVNVKYENITAASANLTVPVLFNGNLGYDLEYNVTGFDGFSNGYVITGDVVIDVKDDSSYLAAGDMNRTDVWAVNLAEGCELEDAYIFVPYNWFNGKKYVEDMDMFNLTFNGQEIVPVGFYRDQGNLGNYGNYGYGVLIYRVNNLINVSGDNTLVLNKNYPTPAVYPSVLVYLYNAPGGSFKDVSMLFGADLLSNANNNANRTVKSDSEIKVSSDDYVNATLYVLAASAQKGESNIVVNGKEFSDVWNGTSKTTDLFTADIADIIGEYNNVSFVATGSTILALPQIIVADTGLVMSVDSIKPEYTSVPAAYAGTNNTLTVTVTNTKDGEFTVYLLDGLNTVDQLKVNLTNGTHTLLLTDPTIRPVDETTVNGAENKKVNYTVVMMNGKHLVFSTIQLPVLYNGNLGKDLEYNATYIEDIEKYTITGNVETIIQPDSTYMNAAATNRTDVWTVDVDNVTIVKAFVYVAYNWDKSGVNGPVFNASFNGVSVSPKSSYRDQGNLGNYGKYGYGLFVYDVTDLIKNENTFILNKESGLTAVYPSSFVYLYNETDSEFVMDVYMADGADLLSNSNNNAGRIVQTDNVFNIDTDKAISGVLTVFAASAQKGESNIILNGNEFTDVWGGSSNSLNNYSILLQKSDLAETNNVSFVATGSTILALNQIFAVISPAHKLPAIIDVNVSEASAGEDVNVTINVEGATGNVSVISDIAQGIVIPLDENGTTVFTINNAPGGTHYLLVSYDGDKLFDAASLITLFDVAKLTPEINITVPADLKIGQFTNLTVEIPGASGNVTVIIDTLENNATLENGIANIPMEVTPDEHSIVVIYNGDDTYGSAYKTSGYYVELFDSKFMNITLSGGFVLSGVLVDSLNDAIANATIDYAVDGVKGTVTTGADGSFAVQAKNNAAVSIAFAGTPYMTGSNIDITIKNMASDKLGSEFNVTEGISIKTYAVDTPAGEIGQTTSFKLTDTNGNPIVNATVKFAYKTVILERTTDENGIVFIGINTQVAQEALCAMSYLGDEKYNATFVAFSFDIQKKPITITASAKTYKASAKTKKYTVTIKTEKCNSRDGKVYLSAGKKLTMKINGKTYTAKTNAKGQATFNLKITKKGKFSSTVKFAGDKTYASASKSVKITIS